LFVEAELVATLKDQIRQVFGNAPAPLSELARFAVEGVAGNPAAYDFILKNGLEAVRQLLRYLTDMPKSVGCRSDEHFVLGYESRTDPPAGSPLREWRQVLSDTLTLAMVKEVHELNNAENELAERSIALMRKAAPIASPRLIAWS